MTDTEILDELLPLIANIPHAADALTEGGTNMGPINSLLSSNPPLLKTVIELAFWQGAFHQAAYIEGVAGRIRGEAARTHETSRDLFVKFYERRAKKD